MLSQHCETQTVVSHQQSLSRAPVPRVCLSLLCCASHSATMNSSKCPMEVTGAAGPGEGPLSKPMSCSHQPPHPHSLALLLSEKPVAFAWMGSPLRGGGHTLKLAINTWNFPDSLWLEGSSPSHSRCPPGIDWKNLRAGTHSACLVPAAASVLLALVAGRGQIH